MGDVPVGAVPAPEVSTATPVKPTNPVVVAREKRAAKLAEVSKGLTKLGGSAEAPKSAVASTDALPSEKVEPPKAAQVEKPVEEPKQEPAPEPEKPTEPEPKADDEQPDPKTAKALAAIDKQAKKFREEQAAAKREFEQEMADQRAEFARERAAFKAEADSFANLQKMHPLDAIRKLRPNMTEDDWEVVGRGAFPFTKAGKADPRAAEIAARTHKESTRDSELADLRKELAEMRETMAAQSKATEARSYVDRWSGDAVKSIPSDKKTLIGNLHAKAPEKAKQALLAIGAELERANGGETPDYADVIAEFEKRERAELEARGVDVDALLKPATAAPAPKPAPKTLDVTAPTNGTRPINGSPSRAEKLAAISAGLKKLGADA